MSFNHSSGITKPLRKRYSLALSIIAILVIMSQGLIQYALQDQEGDSRVINVAGRQRMLSQRITKCTLLIQSSISPEDRQTYLVELEKARGLWIQSHNGLQKGDENLGLPEKNSDKIKEMFAMIEPNYQAILQALDIITADGVSSNSRKEALQILLINQAEFLSGMDAIVFQYDAEAKQKVNNIKHLEFILLIVTFFVLLLEALFIFRPAEKQIQKIFDDYQNSEEGIKKLFDMIPTPMMMIKLNELQIMRVNQAAANLLDISEEEPKDKFLQEFIDNEQNDNSIWNHVVSRGRVTGIELPMHLRGDYAMVMAFTTHINYRGKLHLILGLVDITTKHNQSRYFEQLAATDHMTGLMNRRAFLENLEAILGRVQEGKMEVSLAFLDLDGLKKVNDNYGHREGDFYISTVSSIVRSSLREYDILGRLGGDEFAVILPWCSKQEAERIIYRIQQQVDNLSQTIGKPYSMGFSAGIFYVKPGEKLTAESLIEKADEAMYLQKQVRQVVKT